MSWENLSEDILDEFVAVQRHPESLLAGWSAFKAERERERSEDRRATIYAVPPLYQKWLVDNRRWAQATYERMREDPARWAQHLERASKAYERRKQDPAWLERRRTRARASARSAWPRKAADPQWMERRRAQKRAAYEAQRRKCLEQAEKAERQGVANPPDGTSPLVQVEGARLVARSTS